eukprot:1644767-Pyramimonas_sp.AAC.1
MARVRALPSKCKRRARSEGPQLLFLVFSSAAGLCELTSESTRERKGGSESDTNAALRSVGAVVSRSLPRPAREVVVTAVRSGSVERQRLVGYRHVPRCAAGLRPPDLERSIDNNSVDHVGSHRYRCFQRLCQGLGTIPMMQTEH